MGERVGLQKKTIFVSTGGQPVATALDLVVHIPELLHLTPPFLAWQPGEPLTAKTIDLAASPDAAPLSEVSVQSSNRAVTAELQPVVEGRKYQIRITPTAAARPIFAALTIHCRVGSDTKIFRAFASVQPPSPFHPPPKSPAAVAPLVPPE